MIDPASERKSLRLNAALDGELDAANSLELEREIAADPALALEYRRLSDLRDAVRRHAPREAAPFADRIAGLIAAAPDTSGPRLVPPTPPARVRRFGFSPAAMALAASLGILGFAAGLGVTALRSGATGQDAALVSDFTRAQIAGQPFDVASSDRHTVKPWLAGRTTVSASIVDLASAGFPLAGGRVSVVDRVPAPTLVYRHNEHLVAVTELPPDGATRAVTVETIDGYHVARWSDPNLAFVAVSDMDEKTLSEFVGAFRRAQKPAAENQ